LEAHLSALIVGQSSLVVVTGPAGIGKTTLVQRVRAQAPELLDTRFVTRCSFFDTSPTDPLDRLRQRSRRPGAQLVRPDDTSPALKGPDRAVSERRVVGAVVDAILASATGPALIVVDDLQWAGPAVLDFVELVAVEIDTRRAKPVMLVLVTRPLPPGHPTGSRLARIAGETAVHSLDLEPISEAADADLVRAIAPDASTTLVGYIRRAAGGNPLITMATLRLLQGHSLPLDLRPDDRRGWPTLTYELATTDPLSAWLDSFPPMVLHSCVALALVGAETTIELAATAIDRPHHGLAEGLERATAEGIVAANGDWYWFRHDLYREHFYRHAAAAERRAGHTRLARHLLATPGPRSRSDHIQLCRHLLEGDPSLLEDGDVAAALAVGGAAAAAGRGWAEACRFYEAHLGARPRPAADCREEASLLLQVGLAHYFNSDSASAARRLEQALEAAPGSDERLVAAILVPLLRIRTARDPAALRRPAEVPRLDQFLASSRDPVARSAVLHGRADSLITAGLADEGTKVARLAFETAVGSGDQQSIAFAAAARGFAALLACRPQEAIPWYERAVVAATDADDWYASNTARCRLSFALLGSGQVIKAVLVADQIGREAERDRDFTNAGLSHAIRGTAAYLAGDFTSAQRELDLAASAGRRAEYAPMPLVVTPTRLLVDLATDTGPPAGDRLDGLPPSLAASLRAIRAGAPTGVGCSPIGAGCDRPRLRRLYRITELEIGGLAAAVLATLDPTRWDDLSDRDDVDEAIEVLETVVDGGLHIPTTVPVVLRRALGRALAVTGRHGSAIEHLTEAGRLCRSQDCRAELSLTLLETAMVNSRAGRDEESMGQALEADVLARRLGMPLISGAARRFHRQKRVTSHDGRQLTILVSDVAGSTVVGQRLGDRAYFELVMEHHALVRQLLGVHRGTEFSEGGDSLLAWFEHPSEAFACAAAIQSGAARRRRSGSLLEAKIGVAQGHPFFSHGRPYGSVVNRAARLAAYAPANTIAVDEETMVEIDVDPIELRTAAVDLRGIGRETVGIITSGRSC
jgi:class 3 adenylate cyclase